LNRDLILGAYGMPLHILGITETSNRSTAESAEYVYARWVIRPRLQRLKHKLNQLLVPAFGDDLGLDYEDPTPENRDQARADAGDGLSRGYMTLDEARELMGLDALEGTRGKVFLWPMVLMPTRADRLSTGEEESPEASMAKPTGMAAKAHSLTEVHKDRMGQLHVKRLNAHEARFRSEMMNYFAGQAKRLKVKLRRKGKAVKRADSDDAWWEEEIAALALLGLPLLRAILLAGAQDAIADYALAAAFDMTTPRVSEWIGERLRKFSTAVTDTTKEAIIAELREAEANGESIADMVQRIADYYDGIEYRAERTARTEVLGSLTKGAREAYRQAGLTKHQWWASLDERTREAHVEAHGQVVGLDEKFYVGGEYIEGPGDGSPENAINCRCADLPYFD